MIYILLWISSIGVSMEVHFGIKQGPNNGNVKLTVEQVIKIREILKEKKLGFKQIAHLFNVSTKNIGCISRGQTWKQLL